MRRVRALLVIAAMLAAASAHYVVRSGDTLSRIARHHGTSPAAIATANDLEDANFIYPGQLLDVPAVSSQQRAASRAEAERLVEAAAGRYGWNPAFVKAVAYLESGFNNRVVSSSGAVGIMQVLPSTGEFVSDQLVGRPLDLSVPADNVEAGVAFLDYLYGLTGGDARLTLAGYYQGLRSVRQHGVYDSTEQYIANVLALKQRF